MICGASLWRILALCLLAALIGSVLGEQNYPEYCSNFEDRPGRCIHYRRCPPIFKIVQKKKSGIELNATELHIWNQAGCSQERKTYVCCADEINAYGLALLQNETECGKFTQIKVTNGRKVRMGSRPWMALLKYDSPVKGRHQFICGATLISKRFVLTAAHCVERNNTVSVRLGEHNLITEIDCTMVGSRKRCQPAYQDIGIEKIILHEGFPKNVTQNDIALIKLDRDVVYSHHINPICLPLYPVLQKAVMAQSIYLVTGWGRTESSDYSDVPREAFISRVPLQKCNEAYKEIAFAENQICTSAARQDSCIGDSGGPLLYAFKYNQVQRFVQAGIVSFGSNICGLGTFPAVYTDLVSFLPWITKQMAQP